MLTAPAVDDEVLEPGREFNRALQNCRRCLVYHSERDGALIGYRFAAGDRALGLKGPQRPEIIESECPEVFVVNCKKVVHSHGGYRASAAYYEHWSRVLREVLLLRFETLQG
jgi:hypothetical protein